jgi:hypothetical protein
MRKKISRMENHINAGKEVIGASLVPIVCIDDTEYFLLFKRNHGPGKGTYTSLGGCAEGSETGIQAATRKAYDLTSGYLVVLPEDVLHSTLPGNWPTYFVSATGILSSLSACLNHEYSDCKMVATSAKAIFSDHEVNDVTELQLYHYIQWKLANG